MKANKKLSYHIFNPCRCDEKHVPFIESIYRLWFDVWGETFRELGVPGPLASDHFTRHEQVGALLCEDVPIGLCLLSSFDLRSRIWQEDSCFAAWPRETLLGIAEKHPGKKVLVSSYFTLDKKWRRAPGGISYKNLLAGIVVHHFFATECTAMVATTRKNRGMADQTYLLGAEPVVENGVLHGVPVDLVLFDRESCRPPRDFLTSKVWENRTVYNNENNQTEIKIAS